MCCWNRSDKLDRELDSISIRSNVRIDWATIYGWTKNCELQELEFYFLHSTRRFILHFPKFRSFTLLPYNCRRMACINLTSLLKWTFVSSCPYDASFTWRIIYLVVSLQFLKRNFYKICTLLSYCINRCVALMDLYSFPRISSSTFSPILSKPNQLVKLETCGLIELK